MKTIEPTYEKLWRSTMHTGTMLIMQLLALAALYLLIAAWIYHKLSSLIDSSSKKTNLSIANIYSQIEALLGLYVEVKPTHGFPPMRGWAASPDFLYHLVRHIQDTSPKTVLECSSGVSTLIISGCIRNYGGHVFSLEHDPVYASKTRRLLELHKFEENAQIIDAPLGAIDLPDWHGSWYNIEQLPKDKKIDMLVIDGPPATICAKARLPALYVLSELLAEECTIFLDDAAREDESLIVAQWLREFPQFKLNEFAFAEKGIAVLTRSRSTR
ncbi:class I SAM-dependent methyltransferase [Kineobactrum sediminis]|uniref:Class I SAM-dependent methyltransferase n=2 Tax=Kineobactrum sediminis TaxID=1905677 RepID=A0A2N5XZE9_9GAMM|nr:class I SAM-dependent methyltransferase [Kineobactrum sediminis]